MYLLIKPNLSTDFGRIVKISKVFRRKGEKRDHILKTRCVFENTATLFDSLSEAFSSSSSDTSIDDFEIYQLGLAEVMFRGTYELGGTRSRAMLDNPFGNGQETLIEKTVELSIDSLAQCNGQAEVSNDIGAREAHCDFVRTRAWNQLAGTIIICPE